MPHRPFKSSPHTTNQKMDPSQKPPWGPIYGQVVGDGTDPQIIRPDRSRWTMKGTPGCELVKATGDRFRCTGAVADVEGNIRLNFDTAPTFEDGDGIIWPQKDPAIRGPAGEYFATIPVNFLPPPMGLVVVATRLRFAAGSYHLDVTYSGPIDGTGATVKNHFAATLANGTMIASPGTVEALGGSTITVTLEESIDFDGPAPARGCCSTLGAGLTVVSVIGAVPAADITNNPCTPRIVSVIARPVYNLWEVQLSDECDQDDTLDGFTVWLADGASLILAELFDGNGTALWKLRPTDSGPDGTPNTWAYTSTTAILGHADQVYAPPASGLIP